jgi:hypothetical protein
MIDGRRRSPLSNRKTMMATMAQVPGEDMPAMKVMEHKAQQQTLSIRVSDSVRQYLDRSKK